MPLVIALLAFPGCGGGDESTAPAPATTSGDAMTTSGDAAAKSDGTATKKEGKARRAGATITVGSSEFGKMLFDSREQAIYIFENDPKGESVCYDDCAEAWPPVLTKGEPKASEGVDAALLGTIERRDGKTQVTYAGKPLYFYAHESPGEVRCHNVELNGGLWWVVGPDGKRRP